MKSLAVVLLSATIASTTFLSLPKFQCNFQPSTETCTFNNVLVREGSNTGFKPTTTVPSEMVRRVNFVNSTVEVFGPEICNCYENLEELYLDQISLARLQPDAFHNCTRLRLLSMSNNRLSSLPSGIFNRSSSLINLNVSVNEWVELNSTWFRGLENLESFDVSCSKLKEFPAVTLLSSEKLRELYIASNNFFDIDEANLDCLYPHLQRINFDDNLLACQRVPDFIFVFRSSGVQVLNGTICRRERFLDQLNVDGIICLDDARWSSSQFAFSVRDVAEANEVCII